jgi:micrococcal nuclease
MKTFLLLISLLFVFPFAEARKHKASVNLSGVVESCHDGDTCRVRVKDKVAKVRFAGVDTPELKQKYGLEAQRFVEHLVLGREVNLQCDGASWDRITCTVYLEDRNINRELVQAGWAYDSPKYSKGSYKQDEILAKSRHLGIWAAGTELTSPYCFRHKANKRCRVSALYMP